ncbi:MAG: molybdenum ABC transporter permease subunit [Spirochaetes bacterium GWF1_31_7]|nr:MAG: molybdenum ABC transporter permease subunit [Spirochaetes bacterium GWE1_32_154]OHD44833.1 MAG: molybdenum ABC transporter permease subunit [Spirochaetes bacterium GWE2_31_10]OHD49630.1 MAG: molybdenum ABC transporter permease subunit [Spirochaetes bacterium GWF1_31_7]OHD79114.1 MAG: molybdenum ABC transporter permease subunit [Spirochaetes bacterium RIFOXYB1_FULL_32_8]HBD93743.1 molybdate ABC transporter permease subunit [Spirochaetia bacterium]
MQHINLFPLYLSFKVALISTMLCIIVGMPLSYCLARKQNHVSDFFESLTNLPIVLPPTVLGYYILVLLGRQSPVGRFLEDRFDIMLVFNQTGAVIASTIVALPYIIKSSRVALSGINSDYIHAARILGRSEINIFFTIIVPIAWPGIFAGISMAFVRALGDFGATLMVAGSIPDKTLTMSIAIYDALQAGNEDMANSMVFIMTIIAVSVLFVVNRLEKKLHRWE